MLPLPKEIDGVEMLPPVHRGLGAANDGARVTRTPVCSFTFLGMVSYLTSYPLLELYFAGSRIWHPESAWVP
jgi:hypothetical protein